MTGYVIGQDLEIMIHIENGMIFNLVNIFTNRFVVWKSLIQKSPGIGGAFFIGIMHKERMDFMLKERGLL